jgi:hypothetical protein
MNVRLSKITMSRGRKLGGQEEKKTIHSVEYSSSLRSNIVHALTKLLFIKIKSKKGRQINILCHWLDNLGGSIMPIAGPHKCRQANAPADPSCGESVHTVPSCYRQAEYLGAEDVARNMDG